VARVDVSVDGGDTYNTATGTVGWVYIWTATSLGTVTIKSRAVDSTGIQEDPPTTVVVTVAEPPTITSHFPADGANDVLPNANVTITFSKDMDPATVNNSTVELRDQSGALVSATVSYDAASRTATLDPTATLLTGAVYSVTVRGGLTEPTVKDLLGIPPFGDTAWLFTTSLRVLSVTPAPGATNISLGIAPAAIFSEALDPTTVNDFTVLMTDATANPILAKSIYVPSLFKVLITPNTLLQQGQTYTITLKGGAVGNRITTSAGAPLPADYIWSFTLVPPPPPFPSLSIWSPEDAPSNPATDDPEPKELGLKFRSDHVGVVTGIRFYKGDTTFHEPRMGRLWTSSGTLLGSFSFGDESRTGWYQLAFPQPIPIVANTTYVVSYSAPNGHYVADPGYFESQGRDNGPLHAPRSADVGGNGVIGPIGEFPSQTSMSTNYWVDVVFRDTSALAPRVIEAGLGDIPFGATKARPAALFSEALDPASLNASTVMLTDQENNLVPANISYDASTLVVTITPERLLHFGEVYTVTYKGGSAAPHITDSEGTPLAYDYTWFFSTEPPISGESILVLTSTRGNKFAKYYQEILRAEGFRNISVYDIGEATDLSLSQHDVIILGETPLIPADITRLSNWVARGGKLIAMRPDEQLASLLGISNAAASRSEAYLQVDTSREPGAGIVGETIQYHGTADLYTLEGDTRQVATLYSSPTEATPNPAVTLRSVGTNGGQVAAFAFDLAQSIIYTRQGNPEWAGQDRDGDSIIRTNDLFFSGAEPNYINLDKVAIPQADELQRFLANLILSMNADKIPLPRVWYLPNMKKAVILMTGDDRGTPDGSQTTFDMLNAASPANCSVADWECYRATSWVSPETGLTTDQALTYFNQRFEVGPHITTNCENWTPETLNSIITNAQDSFSAKYGFFPGRTNRIHCGVWTDWATLPNVELNRELRIRLDATYYYWPTQWVQNRPGFMTGSGIPMPYVDLDGSIIFVYQAAMHLNNETDNTSDSVNSLLDKALGPEGFYGVFGARYDYTDQFAATILNSARARDVSLISAEQLLTWLDGRNSSGFTKPVWNGTQLEFRIVINDGVNNVYAMIPNQGRGGQVSSITIDDTPVSFEVKTIKGRMYAVFRATNGNAKVIYTSPVP
jgi:hypothetical protein